MVKIFPKVDSLNVFSLSKQPSTPNDIQFIIMHDPKKKSIKSSHLR